jgi:iron uptake system EfeUOB component EfeO/EfeM
MFHSKTRSVRGTAAATGGTCRIATAEKRALKPLQIFAFAACFFVTSAAGLHASATPLDDAAERYRPYLVEGIDASLKGAQALQERVSANDLEGARQAWLSARAGWERSEVFTSGFVPKLDQEIDAWPNATAGFHAIEAKLFGAKDTNVKNDVDGLVAHLTELDATVRKIALTPQGLLNGTAQLAYEVGESKSDGGESRVSGTSLDDMRNNIGGIDFAYSTIFAAELEARDPKLAATARAKIEQLKALAAVKDLTQVDVPTLRNVTEELVIAFQSAAPKIGLGPPSLEPTP